MLFDFLLDRDGKSHSWPEHGARRQRKQGREGKEPPPGFQTHSLLSACVYWEIQSYRWLGSSGAWTTPLKNTLASPCSQRPVRYFLPYKNLLRTLRTGALQIPLRFSNFEAR